MRISKTTRIEFLSLVVAALALAVSVRGCFQSNRALEISERATRVSEEESKRSILAVWKGNFSRDNETLQLLSMDQSMAIQLATVWLPPNFTWDRPRPDLVLTPPDYTVPLNAMRTQLGAFLAKRGFVKQLSENHSASLNGGVEALPMVIVSTYVAKGEVHTDRALYLLMFQWSPPTSANAPPSVTFTALQLEARLADQDDLEKTLEATRQRTLQGTFTGDGVNPYIKPYDRSRITPQAPRP